MLIGHEPNPGVDYRVVVQLVLSNKHADPFYLTIVCLKDLKLDLILLHLRKITSLRPIEYTRSRLIIGCLQVLPNKIRLRIFIKLKSEKYAMHLYS